MQQIAATHRGVKSPRLHCCSCCCCDKAACAYFVAVICRTKSNQFEFVRQMAATKFCRSDNDFHIVTQGDLLQQPIAETCQSDLSHSVSRLLGLLSIWDLTFAIENIYRLIHTYITYIHF